MLKRAAGLVLASLVCSSVLVGCGTVLGLSGLQDCAVTIRPETPDAVVFVNGKQQGKGSGTYKIDSRLNSNKIEVQCADGRNGSANCPREVNAGVVICDALMLVFPIYMDWAWGGLYTVPHEATVNLGKAPEPSATPNAVGPTQPTQQIQYYDCPVCGEKRPVGSAECPHCGVK